MSDNRLNVAEINTRGISVEQYRLEQRAQQGRELAELVLRCDCMCEWTDKARAKATELLKEEKCAAYSVKTVTPF